MSELYAKAGVNLEAGYESVARIKPLAKATSRLGVFGGIGGFGAIFDLSTLNLTEPLLVSGTDGVGTKLLLAIEMDKHDTVGIDLVAMCVNDIVVQGAEPLYFLDYLATGKVSPDQVEAIVKGIASGCQQAGAALIGGETAEMPDMYETGDYDLAGFAVGAVEKSRLITGEKISIGDILIGLPSSGVHSNGFSLVRKIINTNNIELNQQVAALGCSVGEALLEPTRIYVLPVLHLLKAVDVHGISHITGGGFDENIPRMLPNGCGVKIDTQAIKLPPIFEFLQQQGALPRREMYNIFNMGIGMVIAISPDDVTAALAILAEAGEAAVVIGEVIPSETREIVLH